MRWRYYLIDRFGNKTQIDDPVGWDTFSVKIKRHPERHGTFREVQANQFNFYNTAYQLLRAEWELYGIRGQYTLLIEEKCGLSFEEMYRGKVGFDTYKHITGEQCYVTAQCDQIGPIVDFINRFDQKVDLSKTVCFDNTTALTNYTNLNRIVRLPSKAILLRGNASNSQSQEYIISNDSGWFPVAGTGMMQGGLVVPFNTTDESGIKDFTPQALMDYYNTSNLNENFPQIVYNNPEQDLNCTGSQFTIQFRVKGAYKNLNTGSGTQNMTLSIGKGTGTFYTRTLIQSWSIINVGNQNAITQPFDISYSATITLAPGEKLWVAFFLSYFKSTNYTTNVRLQIDPETFFKSSMISKCDATTAKLYAINETASRVAESITNNQLKVYSEFYGRKDSQPFSFPANGCGAFKALSTGLDIRNQKLSDGSAPKMFLSMKDIFESLNAIDNIGIGYEPGKIRMEPWKFFYQDTVILKCRDIDKVERGTFLGDHYSIFKTGYEKWEAENYNGLDEFLTKREFRTTLSEVQNTLEKVCKWIASGYAWEVTRRKQKDTKDWRFDNDVFVVCLSRIGRYIGVLGNHTILLLSGSADNYKPGDVIVIDTPLNAGTYNITGVTDNTSGGGGVYIDVVESLTFELITAITVTNNNRSIFEIEINNIANPANILDPATVYNYRISPIRMALRWFSRIAMCYKNITNADKLHFSSGDGNYIAEGELNSLFFDCITEAGVIRENADIDLTSFADPDDGMPINWAERVKYKHPMSKDEYLTVAANPLGLIEFHGKNDSGKGWIDEIEWLAEEGSARFTLIPKI